MTWVGMLRMRAPMGGKKDMAMAMTAAPPMTQTLKTRVMAMTPMFSPYVVFGGPPSRPETAVATPSPASDRWSPGSFTSFCPTTFSVTMRWPMCSVMTTSEMGASVRMAPTGTSGR